MGKKLWLRLLHAMWLPLFQLSKEFSLLATAEPALYANVNAVWVMHSQWVIASFKPSCVLLCTPRPKKKAIKLERTVHTSPSYTSIVMKPCDLVSLQCSIKTPTINIIRIKFLSDEYYLCIWMCFYSVLPDPMVTRFKAWTRTIGWDPSSNFDGRGIIDQFTGWMAI